MQYLVGTLSSLTVSLIYWLLLYFIIKFITKSTYKANVYSARSMFGIYFFYTAFNVLIPSPYQTWFENLYSLIMSTIIFVLVFYIVQRFIVRTKFDLRIIFKKMNK